MLNIFCSCVGSRQSELGNSSVLILAMLYIMAEIVVISGHLLSSNVSTLSIFSSLFSLYSTTLL